MSTPKLLWSMTTRGCGWTTGIGALLGAGYGIILFATMMLSLGQFSGDNVVLPLFIVILYAVLIAALFGAGVAGAIGFIAGPIGGLFCGVMTRLFYLPLGSERPYRLVTGIAGGLYGMLALAVAVRLISTSGYAPPIETTRETIMLYIFPALLGGAAGIYISQKVAAWYMQASRADANETSQKPIGAAGLA